MQLLHFHLFSFDRDLAVDQRAWDMTSQLPTFDSHRSGAFLRVVLVTQLTDDLETGSLVSCRSFMSKIVRMRFDSLLAETMVAVKSWGCHPLRRSQFGAEGRLIQGQGFESVSVPVSN